MDDTLTLKALAERDSDGDKEDAESAVNKVSEQHSEQSEQGVHSHRVADDLRLYYLTDDTEYRPQHKKTDALAETAGKHGYYRPGKKYKP